LSVFSSLGRINVSSWMGLPPCREALRLISEVLAVDIAALAAGGDRFGAHLWTELYDCHEAVVRQPRSLAPAARIVTADGLSEKSPCSVCSAVVDREFLTDGLTRSDI
jgi:hypothetical protein